MPIKWVRNVGHPWPATLGHREEDFLVILMWKGVHKTGFTFKKQVIGQYACKFIYIENM